MKKFLLLLTVLVGTLKAQAGDYTYLTFETTDGAKASVAVEGLSLTISGTTLTAGNSLRYRTLARCISQHPMKQRE